MSALSRGFTVVFIRRAFYRKRSRLGKVYFLATFQLPGNQVAVPIMVIDAGF